MPKYHVIWQLTIDEVIEAEDQREAEKWCCNTIDMLTDSPYSLIEVEEVPEETEVTYEN